MLSCVSVCNFFISKLQKTTQKDVALAVFERCQMSKLCRQRFASGAGEPVGYTEQLTTFSVAKQDHIYKHFISKIRTLPGCFGYFPIPGVRLIQIQ